MLEAIDSTSKKKISVVTGQGGGGHYAAYRALRAIAQEKDLPWEFQVTDMDEIIDSLTAQNEIQNAYELFGISGHDLYNLMLKSGWTWMWPLKMRLNKFLVRLNYDVGCAFFEQHWQQQQPDLVVSFMPLYNKGLCESLKKVNPRAPYVTVMTDLADYPPAFWLEPEAESHTVCATAKALEQGRSLGVREDRLLASSGMLIHPKFYSQPDIDVGAERQKLGLDPHKRTGLVMFGGNGSAAMLEIAEQLSRFHQDLQLIFLCGKNEALADSLQQLVSQQQRFVSTFTTEVPYYMQLCDFFIGKPGPGSLSEALLMNLPVITECNTATLIHERYNTEWLLENQAGIVLKSFKRVDKAVEQLLDPDTFERYRANATAVVNNGVFEVIDMLQQRLAAVEIAAVETNAARPIAQTAASPSVPQV